MRKAQQSCINRSHLVAAVAETLKLAEPDSAKIVDSIFSAIVRALQGGDRVEIRGFGAFGRRRRGPRRGRNPRTGAAVAVPAKNVARFKASATLLRDLNRELRPSGE